MTRKTQKNSPIEASQSGTKVKIAEEAQFQLWQKICLKKLAEENFEI